jgi:hypothetical protein
MREDKLRYKTVEDAFYSFCDPYPEDEVDTMIEEEKEEDNLSAEEQQNREENVIFNTVTESIELIPSNAEVYRYINNEGKEVIEVTFGNNNNAIAYTNYPTVSPQNITAGKVGLLSTPNNDDSPTVTQALRGSNADKWTESIKAEVDQLLKGTLKPVSTLQPPYKFFHTTTQLKAKKNSMDGTIAKYKCRICARGNMLADTLAPSETYSPTINALTTFATVLQLSIIFKLIRKTNDTIGAYFLYQNYPIDEREPLYTKLEKPVAIFLYSTRFRS